MILPNLFIVGAPKCGTSSLFDWLASHPDIAGSTPKEPFFLTDPSHPLSRRPNRVEDGMAAYEGLFVENARDTAVRMEATTHYLFDGIARDAVASIPDARAIIVVREPAARVYSSFQYTANNLGRLSRGLNFARYLDLVESGQDLFPKWCSHAGSAYVLQRDTTYSRYAEYVAPWIEALGRDRIRILIMEEMIDDPDAAVRDVVHWLGLDPAHMPPVDRKGRNRTQHVRAPAVQGLARRINARIRPPEPLRRLAKKMYGAMQFRGSSPIPPEDAGALARLKARYADDIDLLSEVAGIDFGIWMEAAQTEDRVHRS